jgi:hypothetical protein
MEEHMRENSPIALKYVASGKGMRGGNYGEVKY